MNIWRPPSRPGFPAAWWTKLDAWSLTALLVLILVVYGWHLVLRPGDIGHQFDGNFYLTGAKSLAEGSGYRVVTDPRSPPLLLHPPLPSAYLALFWAIDPRYPQNVPILNCGLILINLGVAGCSYLLMRRLDVPLWLSALVPALFCLSPIWFTCLALFLSEPFFLLIGLGTVLLWLRRTPLDANRLWWFTGAGLALLYLTRTAAIAFLVPLGFVLVRQALKGQAKPLLGFAVAVVPAVVIWNVLLAGDSFLGYRSYVGERVDLLGGGPAYLGHCAENAWAYLNGQYLLDTLLPIVVRLPGVARVSTWGLSGLATAGAQAMGMILSALAVVGFWQDRRPVMRGITWLLVTYLAMIIFYPAPKDPRFVLPIVPCVVVAAWRGTCQLLGPRVTRRVLAVIGILVGIVNLMINGWLLSVAKKSLEQNCKLPELRELAQWMQTHIPADATLVGDTAVPMLDLHALTGRKIVSALDRPGLALGGSQDKFRVRHRVDKAVASLLVSIPVPGESLVFETGGGAYGLYKLPQDL
jgi:hypothetical protein